MYYNLLYVISINVNYYIAHCSDKLFQCLAERYILYFKIIDF